MEQKECSETSAYKIQPPRNYPEESIEYQCLDRSHLDLCRVQWGVVMNTVQLGRRQKSTNMVQ